MEQFKPYLEPVLGDTWCVVTPFCRMPLYMQDKDRAVLIDSGLRHHGPGILEALEGAGVRVSSLVTSHFHRDHVGSHEMIREAFGCPVYMTPFAAALCDDPRNLRGTAYESPLLTKARGGGFSCKADRIFRADGEVLQLEEGTFRLLPLHGHCQEHVGFITPDGVAYVGDTLLSESVMRALRIPYCVDATLDLEAKESLKTLSCPAYILAHNSTESEIGPVIDGNIANMEQKLALVASLADTWVTQEQLAARVMEATGADLENAGKVVGLTRNVQVLINCLLERETLTHRVKGGFIEYCRSV